MTIRELEQKRNLRILEILNRLPAVKVQLRDQLLNQAIIETWNAYQKIKNIYESSANTLRQNYDSFVHSGPQILIKAVNDINQLKSEVTAKHTCYQSLIQQRAALYRSIITLLDEDIMAIILEKLTKYGEFAISIPQYAIKTKGYAECGYLEDSMYHSNGEVNVDFYNQLLRAIDALYNEGIVLISEADDQGYNHLRIADVIPGNYINSNIETADCANELLEYFVLAMEEFASLSKPAVLEDIIQSVAKRNNIEEKFIEPVLDFLVEEQALIIRTEETITYGAYQKKNVFVTHYLEKGTVDLKSRLLEVQESKKRQAEKRENMMETIAEVDMMEGHEFERWCAGLIQKNGFTDVEVTPGSNDQGVDVVAVKDGIRYAIQCKCYSSDLGNTPVQEVHTGQAIYRCQVGVVMTNRYFTDGAKAAAEATGVLLWDRTKIMEMIENCE